MQPPGVVEAERLANPQDCPLAPPPIPEGLVVEVGVAAGRKARLDLVAEFEADKKAVCGWNRRGLDPECLRQAGANGRAPPQGLDQQPRACCDRSARRAAV